MKMNNKIYVRINWQNRPSSATALGATNLNRMDVALNEMDNRVIALYADKFDKSVANTLVKDISLDEQSGILTVKWLDGSTRLFDLDVEKVVTNFTLNEDSQLVLTLADGTQKAVDLSRFIDTLVFRDSDTIVFTRTKNDVVAAIRNGSIEEEHMHPELIEDIRKNSIKAQEGASDALQYSKDSKRYAVGGELEGDEVDNSKYYYEQSKVSENKAKISESNASQSAESANASASATEQYKNDAFQAFKDAAQAETNAKASEVSANDFAVFAKKSEDNAKISETNASGFAESAAQAEINIKDAELACSISEANAKEAEIKSKEYAERAEAVTDISIATAEKPGLIKAGGDIQVSNDGIVTVKGADINIATEENAGIIKSGGDIQVEEDGSVSVNFPIVESATESTIGGILSAGDIKVSEDGIANINTSEYDSFSDMETAVKGIQNNALYKQDVINAVTSEDVGRPLSAAMGKVLNDKIANIVTDGFLRVYRPAANVSYDNFEPNTIVDTAVAGTPNAPDATNRYAVLTIGIPYYTAQVAFGMFTATVYTRSLNYSTWSAWRKI